MLYAQAKSVREERSKQRYALQECSHVRATLIRGKSGWKVAGAEALQNFYDATDTREARAFVRNTILLLKRVVQGETMYDEVFADVIGACAVAEKYTQKNLEQILSLRILHALGYIAPHASYAHLLHCDMPYHLVDTLTEAEFEKCKEVIEQALVQSQL
jgi:recombinational DNA repair protein (RecF pathway)